MNLETIKNNTIFGAQAPADLSTVIGIALIGITVFAAIQLVRTIKRRAKKAAGAYAVAGAVGTGGATNFQNIPENILQFLSN